MLVFAHLPRVDAALWKRMKVLFLDVDGVLHPASGGNQAMTALTRGPPSTAPLSAREVRERERPSGVDAIQGRPDLFCDQPMSCLARVVQATGAEIVLSSAWRSIPGGVAAVNKALKRWDMQAIADCTSSSGASRVDQIWSWLAEHRHEVDGYAVVDDMDLSVEMGRHGCSQPSAIKEHFVRTPSSVGLSSSHVARLCLKMSQAPHLPNPMDLPRCNSTHTSGFGSFLQEHPAYGQDSAHSGRMASSSGFKLPRMPEAGASDGANPRRRSVRRHSTFAAGSTRSSQGACGGTWGKPPIARRVQTEQSISTTAQARLAPSPRATSRGRASDAP